MDLFVDIPRGNVVQGIIIYILIALTGKRSFVENKIKIFVENPQT